MLSFSFFYTFNALFLFTILLDFFLFSLQFLLLSAFTIFFFFFTIFYKFLKVSKLFSLQILLLLLPPHIHFMTFRSLLNVRQAARLCLVMHFLSFILNFFCPVTIKPFGLESIHLGWGCISQIKILHTFKMQKLTKKFGVVSKVCLCSRDVLPCCLRVILLSLVCFLDFLNEC